MSLIAQTESPDRGDKETNMTTAAELSIAIRGLNEGDEIKHGTYAIRKIARSYWKVYTVGTDMLETGKALQCSADCHFWALENFQG